MNSSPAYHPRRQTGYPDGPSRNYSAQPPPRYRASSVDPFRSSTTCTPVYRSHDLTLPGSNSNNLPPPLPPSFPRHQQTNYRSSLSNRASTLSSTSANRLRITERSNWSTYNNNTSLPRSTSLSKITISPTAHVPIYNDSRPTSSHYYYPRTHYSNSPYYGFGPLNQKSTSPIKHSSYEMAENFSHLSVRPSNYHNDAKSQAYSHWKHKNREVDTDVDEEGASKSHTKSKVSHPRDSPDSLLSSNGAVTAATTIASGSDGSSSPNDANVNNTTSPSSSTSTASYDRRPSSGLHDGRATMSTASSTTSSSNAIGTTASYVAHTPVNGLVGLSNLGNTCFMNSVIQCLSNTRELLHICLDYVYQSELNVNSSMKGNLFTTYANLMHQMWRTSNSSMPTNAYVSPQHFRSQIQKYAPRFMGYAQQDAHEFLRYLVQGLHEDVNRVTKRPPPEIPDYDKEDRMPDSNKATLYWQRYKRIDDSLIADLFLGQLMSTLECMSCGHKSTTFDPFWDLSLPIPRDSDVTILKCFDLFTSNEILDGAELPICSGCKHRQPCRKRFSIQRFPTILVIHLKRFSGERSRSKLTTFIDYPIDHLDLNRYASHCSPETNASYRLYAVSNHSGSVYGGHYTAYCLHPKLGSWFEFNDARVRPISKVDSVSSEAYVLFYQRIDGGSA